MSDTFISPEGFLMYPTLWTAKRYQNKPDNAPRYEATLLILKSDPELPALMNIFNGEIKEKYKTTSLPYGKDGCILDGGIRHPDDPFYADKVILSMSCAEKKGPPEVLLPDNSPVVNHSHIYQGCVARAYIHMHSYDSGKGGIRAELHGIKKYRDSAPIKDSTPRTRSAFAKHDNVDETPSPQSTSPFLTSK